MGKNNADFSGAKNPRYRTGLTMAGNAEVGIYNTWQNMKARCLRRCHPKFSRYGGRGITICQAWLDIESFYAWSISAGWKPGCTIDRIDNDGNYCPENCRWVSASENSRKKRTTKINAVQAADIRMRLKAGESSSALAKEYGVVHGTIWFIEHGYTHVADGMCTKRLHERSELSNDNAYAQQAIGMED